MRVYAWECGLEVLLDFVKIHGHAQVAARHVHHRDKLGSWLMAQRRSIRPGELQEHRAASLALLGVR